MQSGSGIILFATFSRCTCDQSASAILRRPRRHGNTWDDVRATAANPSGPGLERSPEAASDYRRYRDWMRRRGMDSHANVLKHSHWEPNGVAFTPNLLPYDLERGISHWVLWHHPQQLAGNSRLNAKDECDLVRELLGREVAVAEGYRHVRGNFARAWGPRADEIEVFQNVPGKRSIPTIAHVHCFMRPRNDADGAVLSHVLEERRLDWERMQPWLKGDMMQSARTASAFNILVVVLFSLSLCCGVLFVALPLRFKALVTIEEPSLAA